MKLESHLTVTSFATDRIVSSQELTPILQSVLAASLAEDALKAACLNYRIRAWNAQVRSEESDRCLKD